MNRQGEYTDNQGHVLQRGDKVKLLVGDILNEFKGHIGDVVTLPESGSDWHGYVRVILPASNYRRVWALDTQLKRLPPPEKS